MDKEFLEGLAALLNQSPEEVGNLFEQPNGDEPAKVKTESLMPTLKTWVQKRADDVFKEAERRTANRFEKFIKDQGFTSDAKGTDLLAAYAESLKANGSGKSSDPSEWEKKYNDLAPKLENLQKALADKDAAIAEAETRAHRQVVKARLHSDIRAALGTKWAGTEAHFSVLMSQFSPDGVRISESGELVLLNSAGEPLTDELHRPVKFADKVRELGALIGTFHAVDPTKGSPGGTAGGQNQGGNGTGGGISLNPNTTPREFNAMLTAATTPEERQALLKARKDQIEKK